MSIIANIKKTYWKLPNHYFFFSNLFLSRLINHPAVFSFHRIIGFSGSLLDERVGITDPRIFEEILKYLRILGYTFVPLKHLLNNILASQQERVVVITFDDGFKDLYQNAYPILKKLNIPFTLFLTTSNVDAKELLWLHKLYIVIDNLPPEHRVGILRKYIYIDSNNIDLSKMLSKIISTNDKNNLQQLVSNLAFEAKMSESDERLFAEKLYLTKAELLEMKNNGLAIETHGHRHWMPKILNMNETEEEIATSVKFIAREFDERPCCYGLPYGASNEFVKDIARNLALKGIATTESRLLRSSDNLYSIPRIPVLNNIEFFYKKLHREFLSALWEKVKSFKQ